MSDQSHDLPTGKISRLLVGGSTAARVGSKVLGYYAKRPFLDNRSRQKAREEMAGQSARAVFKGLSMLKGTALKMAQQLSLEMDLLPESVCRELARAYHQVPPINRALVRQVIQKDLGLPPEKAFARFDTNAFAAASLGQVHSAVGHDGTPLAVKIQYPGIAKTIDSDLGLLRQALRPMIREDQLLPVLDELAARLREEVDYRQEADNLTYFAKHLDLQDVRIPGIRPELSAGTVLTTTRMSGYPLDTWLLRNPDQAAIDRVAQRLHELFIAGLYKLKVIHADPNPGNFIIDDDLTIGLVDYGCIKRLDPVFVESYKRLCQASTRQDGSHFEEMVNVGLLPADLDAVVRDEIQQVGDAFGNWFCRLYQNDIFDFAAQPDFIAEGKAAMSRFHHLRHHVQVNPEFLFLDRTRYGLLRLFEHMGARVCFRNAYEWRKTQQPRKA